MAKIQIERKSGTRGWLWVLLALAAIAVVWFIANSRVVEESTTAGGEVAPVSAIDDASAAGPVASEGATQILAYVKGEFSHRAAEREMNGEAA